MDTIRVVIATFKNKISPEEIPFFRGSIIRLSDNASFFHNHQEERFRYAYPLVQYKRIEGHAAIWGINVSCIILMRNNYENDAFRRNEYQPIG